MGCPITLLGLSNQCGLGIGGIKEIIIADRTNIGYKVVPLPDGTIGTVVKRSSAHVAYRYEVSKFSSGLESTVNVDIQAGSIYHENSVTVVFNKMDTIKRREVAQLIKGDLIVIVRDGNGIYWFMGLDEPVNVSAGSASTGVAAGDSNNYTLTFTDISKDPLHEVRPVAIPLLFSTSSDK